MTTSSGNSVLSSMVAGVMAQKAGREPAATLTPTVLEAPTKVAPLDGKHDVMFPYDDPQTINQAILDGLKMVEVVTQHLAHVRDGLIALAGLYGTPVDGDTAVAVAAQKEKEQRAKEAMADARARQQAARDKPKPPETEDEFKEDFARKQAEAQAVVFGNPKPSAKPAPEPEPDEDEDEDEAPKPQPADGWVCPKHGAEEISTRVSPRRQVTFRTCQVAGCGLFEKV